MQLSTILIFAAVLACPIAMGVMMWMMNKNMSGGQDHSTMGHTAHISEAERLKVLREQRQRLEQEITETEKIAALEAKKQALTRGEVADPKSQPVNVRN